jgi:hypothetical protein
MVQCKLGPKDCFVIFVVLLDEFDHFRQTFGDKNVNIDSLTLDSPYAKKISAATRNFLELDWRVIKNFDSFFVDDIVFFQNSKNCRVCDVVFPGH